VVVARRAGDAWYVGGISGLEAPQETRVEMSFLGPGSWQMTLIRDGEDDRTFATASRAVTSRDTIEVVMRPRGGFVMKARAALTRSSDDSRSSQNLYM
jgi:hypothetical protein